MKRKKNDSNNNCKQLDLPFGKRDSLEDQPNNLISFSLKIKEINEREETIIRKRSINRLIKYAETLNW